MERTAIDWSQLDFTVNGKCYQAIIENGKPLLFYLNCENQRISFSSRGFQERWKEIDGRASLSYFYDELLVMREWFEFLKSYIETYKP